MCVIKVDDARSVSYNEQHASLLIPGTRIAGIGSGRAGLHPVQERLARAHGSQCGFCTPGFVMSMYSLLRSKTEAPTEEEIEENLAGNLWCVAASRIILHLRQCRALFRR